MWMLVSIFVGSMQDNSSIEHIGNPFSSGTECEAELPKSVQLEIQQMGKDDKGLYVRTEFPQGWVGVHRCMYVWK